MLIHMRQLLKRRSKLQGWFDEPEAAISAPVACFRGWAASVKPMSVLVLEADGRADQLSILMDRPDAAEATKLPYVVGWQHCVVIPPAKSGTRRFTARLFVDGRQAAARVFTRDPDKLPLAGQAPDQSSGRPRDLLHATASGLGPEAMVFEAGTLQSVAGLSTHSRGLFPQISRQNYIMADLAPGPDVDVVADLHALPAGLTGTFDVFIANAVFEHLDRPWIAAREVARILKPGGVCYIATHQTFPLHGYPSDFFRFSTDALSLIFRDAGLVVSDCAYEGRAQIMAPASIVPGSFHAQWNAMFPSYIHVHLFARKSSAG